MGVYRIHYTELTVLLRGNDTVNGSYRLQLIDSYNAVVFYSITQNDICMHMHIHTHTKNFNFSL